MSGGHLTGLQQPHCARYPVQILLEMRSISPPARDSLEGGGGKRLLPLLLRGVDRRGETGCGR